MKPFQKILVACDLSKFTNQVLDYAVSLALSTGARLILGNVINQRDVDAIESAIHKTFLVEKEASPEAYIRQHKLEREANLKTLIEVAVRRNHNNLLTLNQKVVGSSPAGRAKRDRP